MHGLWLVAEVEEILGQVVERTRVPVRTAAAPGCGREEGCSSL